MAEDEIAEDFGRMVRMITGSTMQVRESFARRAQMRHSAAAAEEREQARIEQHAGMVVQRDLFNPEFWKHAGADSIADRMSVAASLGEHNPAARSAWMHGADVIRSTYGLDVQQINRDHPNSLQERDAALRDALDDLVQKRALDAESDVLRAEAQRTGDGLPAERAEAEADRELKESREHREGAEEADPSRQDAEDEVEADGLAARRDFARERAEAANDDARADLAQLRQADPAVRALAQVRERQLTSFPTGPQAALTATAGRGSWGRKGAKTQQVQENAREAAMSR